MIGCGLMVLWWVIAVSFFVHDTITYGLFLPILIFWVFVVLVGMMCTLVVWKGEKERKRHDSL